MDIKKFISKQHNSITEHRKKMEKLRESNKKKYIKNSESIMYKEKQFYKKSESLKTDFNLIRKK